MYYMKIKAIFSLGLILVCTLSCSDKNTSQPSHEDNIEDTVPERTFAPAVASAPVIDVAMGDSILKALETDSVGRQDIERGVSFVVSVIDSAMARDPRQGATKLLAEKMYDVYGALTLVDLLPEEKQLMELKLRSAARSSEYGRFLAKATLIFSGLYVQIRTGKPKHADDIEFKRPRRTNKISGALR